MPRPTNDEVRGARLVPDRVCLRVGHLRRCALPLVCTRTRLGIAAPRPRGDQRESGTVRRTTDRNSCLRACVRARSYQAGAETDTRSTGTSADVSQVSLPSAAPSALSPGSTGTASGAGAFGAAPAPDFGASASAGSSTGFAFASGSSFSGALSLSAFGAPAGTGADAAASAGGGSAFGAPASSVLFCLPSS